uniref:Zyg-9 n=1 Tax=Pristionchus pacificus TaxID=54126 RepID=A0A2A6B437_PRIPA|eukprot:PDM60621.1 zyg-9 [Pristionchus pacificus]
MILKMADWDFLDEVDVLAKLSGDFKEKLESKKWQERKEALEQLQGLLANNPRLSTKANYGEIVNTMQLVLAKDANINCNALAAKCISGFATGLRAKFGPFANQIVPVCAERFKEKKPILRDPLIECIDAVASTVQLENLTEEIVAGMDKQNPQIKLQMDNFIFRQMNKFSADKAPRKLIKLVVPILAKHASEADAEVREASLAAIGSVQRMIGDKNVKSMIGDLEKDENKMKKVNEGAARAAELAAEHAAKTAPPAASSSKNGGGEEETETESAPTSARPAAKAKEADPWDFADAFDILGKMPSTFEGEAGVESKKWTERRDALQALLDLLVANIKLCPKGNYAELVGTLRKILEKDANINVAALAAKCLTHIATGLRAKFGPHASTILPAILEKFKEKKATLATPLVELIDAVVDTTTLESMESDLATALGKPNPQIKGQTALFLKRAFIKLNSTTMPKKTLKALAPLLVKHTGDADTEVREAACAALGAAMAVIGEKPMMTMMGDIADDKLKMGKVKESFEALKGEVQEVAPPPAPKTESKAPTGKPPVKGPVKKAPPKEEKEEEEEADEPPPKSAAKAAPKKVIPAKEEPKEEEEEEVKKKTEELLSVNEEKKMRLKDEKTLKILKWNFAAPDEEHISQLMTLMGAQAKASLVGMLFHKDFKQHIKAIDELNKMADSDPLPLIKNSDLILKWCTLRFFETNPAALIKVLDLALRVLNHCLEMEEPMSTEEISAFMPYLLLKTGEQKENMRQTVRDIIDVLSSICGPLKLCPMVIDALKTKNSRQRAECLSVLEKYVTTVGLAQLKPLGVVKSMAGCVSDRDTNVRNAAINGLVACYRDEGERVWQSAGKMEAKEKQMVEERIKRSGAAPGSARPPMGGTPAQGMRTGGARIVSQQNGGTVVRGRASSRDGSHTRDSSPVTSRGHNSTFNANERGTVSKFQLDDDIDNLPPENNMSMSQVIAQLERVTPHAPSRYGGGTLKRTNSASSIGSSVVDSIEALDKVIQNVSSTLAEVCIEAVEQLSFVLGVEDQRPLLRERVDLLLQNIASQVQYIRTSANRPDAEELKLADRMKALLNFTSNFTLTSTELRCASAETLEPFIYEFIWVINDDRFKLVRECEQV